jgi:hypothetical protein
MRSGTRLLVLAVVVSTSVWAQAPSASGTAGGRASLQAAQLLLRSAREHIGGEARLRRVQTLVLRGKARIKNWGSGPGDLLSSVELRVKLPDQYLRIDTDGRFIRRTGFTGGTPINQIRVLVGAGQASSSPGDLIAERAECARLLLGLLADTRVVLSLRPSADEESGNNSIRLLGRDNFSAWLDFAPQTQMPLRVRYQEMTVAPGGSAKSTPTSGRSVMMPTLRLAEVTETFGDRRETSGLWLPYRITRSASGIVVEDMVVDTIIVNPRLGPTDFK